MASEKSTENWRAVPGFPYLEASDKGNVRSLSRCVKRKKKGMFPVEGQLLRQFAVGHKKRGQQYLAVQHGTALRVHRLIAAAFLGPADGRHVNHKDGDKHNNRLENLEWVTPASNNKHSASNGFHLRGEHHPKAKLTEGDVRLIRELHDVGDTYVELASLFEVSKSSIQCICNRRNWKHVT